MHDHVFIIRDMISIHAPHAGSDHLLFHCLLLFLLFQSTLPMRGAILPQGAYSIHGLISIHAPHAGSDKNHDR